MLIASPCAYYRFSRVYISLVADRFFICFYANILPEGGQQRLKARIFGSLVEANFSLAGCDGNRLE